MGSILRQQWYDIDRERPEKSEDTNLDNSNN